MKPTTMLASNDRAVVRFEKMVSVRDIDAFVQDHARELSSRGVTRVDVVVANQHVSTLSIGMGSENGTQFFTIATVARHPIANEHVDHPNVAAASAPKEGQSRPTLGGLSAFADFFGLDLRRRLKAMAGDYDAEIARLHKEGRSFAARWNKWLAWYCAGWYVLRSPLDKAAAMLVKGFTGK